MNKTKQSHYTLRKDSGNVLLTQREAECIAHMLSGKTICATGEVLGISPRTVEGHVSHIKVSDP